jgi:hypothetical protein
MSADITRNDDAGSRRGSEPEPLDATVVRYRNGPDRCTVAPADVDEDRQLTAWLSVDVDALVGLAGMR